MRKLTRNEMRSAVRVRSPALFFARKSRKKEKPSIIVLGTLSAVDSPKALSLASACYEWLQGTAGGVGESSGIDRLTDVPECVDVEFTEVR